VEFRELRVLLWRATFRVLGQGVAAARLVLRERLAVLLLVVLAGTLVLRAALLHRPVVLVAQEFAG
jgi:hypothetical protein